MRSIASLRRFVPAALALLVLSLATACESDNNPYGVAYRTVHHTIVGAYRPIQDLEDLIPAAPSYAPLPEGSDVRLVFGSAQTLSGRVMLPSMGFDDRNLNFSFYGTWKYDVTTRRITMSVESSLPGAPSEIVVQLTILRDWVRLQGSAEINGTMFNFDLAKLLFEVSNGGGGGGFGPQNRVPRS